MAVAAPGRALGVGLPLIELWAVAWLSGVTLAVGALWIVPSTHGLRFVSVMMLTFGLWLFMRDGGQRITTIGVYSLGMAVFGGLAGLWRSYTAAHIGTVDVTAAVLVFTTHVVTWVVFWNRRTVTRSLRVPTSVNREVTRWGVQVGTLLLVAGEAASRLGEVVGPLPKSLSFVGVVLASTSALANRAVGKRRRMLRGILASSGLFAAYMLLVFSGFGRLVVASLGLAIAIAGGRYVFRRSGKALVVVAILPALAIFGAVRTSTDNPTTGLRSVFIPAETFGEVITEHQEGGVDLVWGDTFVAAAVAQVPAGLWSSKPPGFGTLLTAHFEPAQLSSGHSMAALIHGEWWWNFGPLGMVLMVPALGFGLRWLDTHLARAMRRALVTRRALLTLVTTAIAAAGTLDLFWVGLFTYSARTVTSVLVVAGILCLITPRPMKRHRHRSVASSGNESRPVIWR